MKNLLVPVMCLCLILVCAYNIVGPDLGAVIQTNEYKYQKGLRDAKNADIVRLICYN